MFAYDRGQRVEQCVNMLCLSSTAADLKSNLFQPEIACYITGLHRAVMWGFRGTVVCENKGSIVLRLCVGGCVILCVNVQ